ncbi:MAG: glycosyltransferase family 4 protein [Elainellaceae cyanobacterium]
MMIPAYLDSLGGMTVSLALLAKGFKLLGMSNRLRVLVRTGSLTETYFIENELADVLEILPRSKRGFFNEALRWTHHQPIHWPLLLDNSVWRSRLPKLLRASFPLRRSGRPIYHFCHDLALSESLLGLLARKITFACLNPKVICNSRFTADHVRQIMPNVKGVLYQPVDLDQIHRSQSVDLSPPEALKPILASGARIMLTPSRINQPGIVNDKNLRALIPVLAALKQRGQNYHSVVIGEDNSEGKTRTQDLLKQAHDQGVADRFTILPPTFAIEQYYQYADIVVTLAPREPFGRTVVEAIACGVPVVGSNTGGINEILQNFAPNWTVNPHSPDEVAGCIIQVMTSANTPEVLKLGQQWIRENCSLEAYARGMMQLAGLSSTQSNDCQVKKFTSSVYI